MTSFPHTEPLCLSSMLQMHTATPGHGNNVIVLGEKVQLRVSMGKMGHPYKSGECFNPFVRHCRLKPFDLKCILTYYNISNTYLSNSSDLIHRKQPFNMMYSDCDKHWLLVYRHMYMQY